MPPQLEIEFVAVLIVERTKSFKFIEKLGVDNIRAHAPELTDRLQNELPSERYTSITPKGTESAIVVFLCKDTEDIRNRIRRANEEGRANISIGGPNSGSPSDATAIRCASRSPSTTITKTSTAS